jgi:hypothetical protein
MVAGAAIPLRLRRKRSGSRVEVREITTSRKTF